MSSQQDADGTEPLPPEGAADTLPSHPDAGQNTGSAETLPLALTMLSQPRARSVETVPLRGAVRALASQPAMTLPPQDERDALPSGAGPPVTAWDRYELFDRLGRGGMGSVYRARDRRLDRSLAIKFLLGTDPNLTLRFLREARAQARIDHPNICRVYEVGEVSGRAYIALQLIGGEPLHKAAAKMSLDEKVTVMRDVAAAIHEAHRLGIVHRDLKPANIMVERTPDGRWFPVVMDFGLAREATVEAGLTESGTVLGTPAYMSPEQASGDVHAVDRRSDVYSLGATLFELFTGRPPFASSSLAQLLAQVIHDDPPAPRRLVPSLPVDLETIAQKCLAKDPGQRYPSARALADDLGRYLDGEPILGRRLSRWQRLRLRARRNRALVILGAGSLAIILAVSALGVQAWISSRRERERTQDRTRLAERLGREATEVESFLSSAYLRPLHDTHPDREHVREQMQTIAATRHDLGGLGDAIIHDALGRGHLALHEWQEAADELGRAEAAGWQTPELHAARGRALGELYHRALEEARRTDDKAWLDRRQQELAREYLSPALGELARSKEQAAPASDGEPAHALREDSMLLEARIAFYRGDFATTEQLARTITVSAPWRFEAHKLAADAAYSAAIKAFDHGDHAAAQEHLERATSRYAEASEIARSDASVHEAAAEAWLERAEVDFRLQREPDASIERALGAIERALQAAPDDAQAYTTKAYVLLRKFRLVSPEGRAEQEALLDDIARAAEHAIELDPRDPSTWIGLGSAHLFRGHHEHGSGGQGEPWWSRARDEFDRAVKLQPSDPRAHNGLGAAHRWLGTSRDEAGQDPMPEYETALRSYERATALDPQYVNAWTNQADLHTTIAERKLLLGGDPQPEVEAARSASDRCLAINANFYSPLDTMAQAELALAHYLVETGGDPSPALARARGYLDRSEKLQPESLTIWFHRLATAGVEAQLRLRQGADPRDAIATGRAALDKALRLAPGSADSYVEAARLDLVEAAWLTRAGGNAAAILARARTAAEKAITLDPRFVEAKLAAAEVSLQLATSQRSRAVAERGIAYVDQVLAIHPQLARAQALKAALSRLLAP